MQSQNSKTQLPKIHSQKRIYTATDRRSTEQDKALANRPLSNNGRTRSLRAFTTKTVKYESTGNVYNKKVQDIEKQTFIVDKEIKSVQQQISLLRKNIGTTKKQTGMSRLNESSVSYLSKISTRKIALNADQQTVKTQLKNLQAKILNYRNKIDTHLEKNKTIEQEIDAFRKEISTLKSINAHLQASFKQTSVLYDDQLELSKKLDTQIAQKTQLTHTKKVQNMHQKAQMIKQYDVILKTLDKQLNTQKPTGQEEKSNFYLTDVMNNQLNLQSVKSTEKPSRQIISAKKPRINQIRQKLKNYEKQFQELKSKVGSQNIEQITKKFTQEYQNNFHQYNFINEMYQEYEEANLEQFQLLQKKRQLLKELQAQKSTCKVKQIHEYRDNIQKMNKKKDHIRKDMLLYNKIALELKVYLGQYLNSSKSGQEQKINSLFEQLTDKTVTKRLYDIYQRYSKQLNLMLSQRNRQKKSIKNTSAMGKDTVDDLIQEAKKEGQVSKDNRLLSREQLQRNTIQMKEKKLEASVNTGKFRTKRQAQKSSRTETYKKISRG